MQLVLVSILMFCVGYVKPGSTRLEYLGCWLDKADRAISTKDGFPKDNFIYVSEGKEVAECEAYAKSFNFTVFAIQYYDECWTSPNASETYNKYGELKEAARCPNGIGEGWENAVYQIRPCDVNCGETMNCIFDAEINEENCVCKDGYVEDGYGPCKKVYCKNDTYTKRGHGDDGDYLDNIESAEACQKECANIQECMAWNWSKYDNKDIKLSAKECEMMSEVGETKHMKNMMSGTWDCKPADASDGCDPECDGKNEECAYDEYDDFPYCDCKDGYEDNGGWNDNDKWERNCTEIPTPVFE